MIVGKHATPGDMYEDRHGNMWVVRAYYPEPVVQMEMVLAAPHLEPASGTKIQGGISGEMWCDFELVKKRRIPSTERAKPAYFDEEKYPER